MCGVVALTDGCMGNLFMALFLNYCPDLLVWTTGTERRFATRTSPAHSCGGLLLLNTYQGKPPEGDRNGDPQPGHSVVLFMVGCNLQNPSKVEPTRGDCYDSPGSGSKDPSARQMFEDSQTSSLPQKRDCAGLDTLTLGHKFRENFLFLALQYWERNPFVYRRPLPPKTLTAKE